VRLDFAYHQELPEIGGMTKEVCAAILMHQFAHADYGCSQKFDHCTVVHTQFKPLLATTPLLCTARQQDDRSTKQPLLAWHGFILR
jgi:hypothetical protein